MGKRRLPYAAIASVAVGLLVDLAIAGLMIAAWLGGSPADLPFEYGGFD